MQEDEIPIVMRESSIPIELPEEELRKLAGNTDKKGDKEYVIFVQGINDTGLCGKYWEDLENLPCRWRGKQPERLQIEVNQGRDTPSSR